MSAQSHVTSRSDVAHCGREELLHFLPVLLRGLLHLFSIIWLCDNNHDFRLCFILTFLIKLRFLKGISIASVLLKSCKFDTCYTLFKIPKKLYSFHLVGQRSFLSIKDISCPIFLTRAMKYHDHQRTNSLYKGNLNSSRIVFFFSSFRNKYIILILRRKNNRCE